MTIVKHSTRSLLLALLAGAALSMSGCDSLFTVPIDPEMKTALGLSVDRVPSSDYPRLRERFDAVLRTKTESERAAAQREVDAAKDDAAKTERLETEVAAKAQREMQARIASAQRAHDDSIRDADAELSRALAEAGATATEIASGAQLRAQLKAAEVESRIRDVTSRMTASVAAIQSTHDSVLKAGDAAYAAARASADKWQGFAMDAGSAVLPLAATALGGGALGTLVTAMWGAYRRRQAVTAATQGLQTTLDSQAQLIAEHEEEIDSKTSALDAVTHGIQLAKAPQVASQPLPATVKTLGDAVKLLTKQFIESQATPEDKLVIEASAAGAGVT